MNYRENARGSRLYFHGKGCCTGWTEQHENSGWRKLPLRPLRLCGSVFVFKPPASLKTPGTQRFFPSTMKSYKFLNFSPFTIQENHAWASATETATDAPTMGLLPMPIKPIISTCAGTEELPANCASQCIRPMVSVIP